MDSQRKNIRNRLSIGGRNIKKIVRLKKYEDGIYNTEEYQHFAVIHVRLPRSGDIHDVEIELNEFQVQWQSISYPSIKLVQI